jgi:cyclopropane fatty-acyl-phospholipid synthase-like methyltransferase
MGYFEAEESVQVAQTQLMERLAKRAAVPAGSHVLDVGCGLGGSAFWLAEQFGCEVTGMTISPVQARMASKKSVTRGLSDRVRFDVGSRSLNISTSCGLWKAANTFRTSQISSGVAQEP